MATADDQRAGGAQPDERSAGGHKLSLAEWLVLCLVREKPTYALIVAGQLARNGSLGQIWYVQKGTVYRAVQRLELLGLVRTTGKEQTSQGPERRSSWIERTWSLRPRPCRFGVGRSITTGGPRQLRLGNRVTESRPWPGPP